MSHYDSINKGFERAIQQLQENLQYLADQGKVSDKFISMQNAILKALISYHRQAETIISELEMDVLALSFGRNRELDKMRATHTSLEAICIIHGITDFPVWMEKGMDYLVNEVISLHKENTILLPYQLIKMIEESLSPSERIILKGILFHRAEARQKDKIRQIMTDLAFHLDLLNQLRYAHTQGDQKTGE